MIMKYGINIQYARKNNMQWGYLTQETMQIV